MKTLNKYPLKSDSAMDYFKETLDKTNTVSTELIRYIDSKNGRFFTLLPKNADVSKLHAFSNSILEQNPLLEYPGLPTQARYQLIPTIRDELYDYLMKSEKINETLSYVFDDYNSTYKAGHEDQLFKFCGLHYGKEVYYLLHNENITRELFIKCLQVSNTFWHSLCILTDTNFADVVGQQLDMRKIRELCLKAHLIIVGAYDGEGYLFWEPL